MLNRYSCSGRGCARIPRGNSIAFVHVCAVGVNFKAFLLFVGDSATAFSSSLKEIDATFTLLRFHLDPFLPLKTELFFLPVHITPFSNKNGYLSTSVHACPQKRT